MFWPTFVPHSVDSFPFNLTPNRGISEMTRKYANSLIQLTKWTKDAGPRTKDLPAPEKQREESGCGLKSRHMESSPEELKRKQKWNYVAPVVGLLGGGIWLGEDVDGGSHTKSRHFRGGRGRMVNRRRLNEWTDEWIKATACYTRVCRFFTVCTYSSGQINRNQPGNQNV